LTGKQAALLTTISLNLVPLYAVPGIKCIRERI
jgi:hypothetical protein